MGSAPNQQPTAVTRSPVRASRHLGGSNKYEKKVGVSSAEEESTGGRGAPTPPLLRTRDVGLRSRVSLSAKYLYRRASPLSPPCTMFLSPASLLCRRIHPQLVPRISTRALNATTRALNARHTGFGRMTGFQRLIRFEGEDGKVHWGDFGGEEVGRDVQGKSVSVLRGSVAAGFARTEEEMKIRKVAVFPFSSHR